MACYVMQMKDKKNPHFGMYLGKTKYVKDIDKANCYLEKDDDILESGDKFVKVGIHELK